MPFLSLFAFGKGVNDPEDENGTPLSKDLMAITPDDTEPQLISGLDEDWEVTSERENNALYYDRWPDLAQSDVEHQKWLGRQEDMGKGKFIVVELGPNKIMRRIALDKVPASSKVLSDVAQNHQNTRNIWLEDLDGDEFYMYMTHCSGDEQPELLIITYDWMALAGLGIAAERLEDARARALADASLRLKVDMIKTKTSKIFTNDVLEYVYQKTNEQSLFRRSFIALVIATDGPLHAASSSIDMLKQFLEGGTLSKDLSASKEPSLVLSPLPSAQDPQSPATAESVMRTEPVRSKGKQKVPLELWQGSTVANIAPIPAIGVSAVSKQLVELKTTGSKIPTQMAIHSERPSRSLPLTAKSPNTHLQPASMASSDEKDPGERTIREFAYTPPPSIQKIPMIPTRTVATTMSVPHGLASAIPKFAPPRPLPKPVPSSSSSLRSSPLVHGLQQDVQSPFHNMPTPPPPRPIVRLPIPTAISLILPIAPSTPSLAVSTMTASAQSTTPSQPQVIPQPCAVHDDPFANLPPPPPRRSYGNSVLRGRLSAAQNGSGQGSGLARANSMKEQPVRQPRLPPTAEQLRMSLTGNGEGPSNFAWAGKNKQ